MCVDAHLFICEIYYTKMSVHNIPADAFHPRLCGEGGPKQLCLYDAASRKCVALVVSHIVDRTCIITAHVYDCTSWSPLFPNP